MLQEGGNLKLLSFGKHFLSAMHTHTHILKCSYSLWYLKIFIIILLYSAFSQGIYEKLHLRTHFMSVCTLNDLNWKRNPPRYQKRPLVRKARNVFLLKTNKRRLSHVFPPRQTLAFVSTSKKSKEKQFIFFSSVVRTEYKGGVFLFSVSRHDKISP